MCTVLSNGDGLDLPRVSVLKFGSSLLADGGGFRTAADEIAREVRRGRHVLAVVSAMRGTTDRLIEAAGALGGRPGDALLSSLLRTGEDASVVLLTIALTGAGMNAHGIGGEALALRTRGPLWDAEPTDVDAERLAGALRVHQAVVVPGFVGRDASGAPSLLGRGGSDLTALFLASRLAAEEVRLVKDVDGVHPSDPSRAAHATEPLASATWSEVVGIGNGVVQEKALRFAERQGLVFRVAAPGGCGTLVGPERDA